MYPVVFLAGLLLIISVGCHGLRLNFALGPSVQNDGHGPCGVLTCVDETSAHLLLKDAEESIDGDPVTSSVAIHNMSSLRVYKIIRTSSASSLGSEILMASVTEAENNVSVVSAHQTVIGQLTPSQASLRLELYRPEDCRARYTCQVITINRNGQIQANVVASPTMGQHTIGSQEAENRDAEHSDPRGLPTRLSSEDFHRRLILQDEAKKDWRPETTIHLISLVEQLHLKMVSMEDKLEGMNWKFSEMNGKSGLTDEVTEKISELDGKLSSLKRVEEKVLMLEGLKERVLEIDGKVSAIGGIKERVLEIDGKVSAIDGIKEKISSMDDITRVKEKVRAIDELNGKVSEINGKLSAMNGIHEKVLPMDFKTYPFAGIHQKISAKDHIIKGKISASDKVEEKVSAIEQKVYEIGAMAESSLEYSDKISDKLASLSNQVGMQLSAVKDEVATFRVVIENIVRGKRKGKGLSRRTMYKNNDRPVADLSKGLDIWVANVTDKVEQGLFSLERRLRSSFKDLVLVDKKRDAPYDEQIEGLQSLQELLINVTNPSGCERNGLIVPMQRFFPYLVVNPQTNVSQTQVPLVCDTHTLGGGWIVIQRRSTGNTNFFRGWETYKAGFGSLGDDFWLGLQDIHRITNSGTYELRVELKYKGKSAFAHYSTFSVKGEEEKFALVLGDYDGTAGDSLDLHRGMAFSTFDKDHDDSRSNCARIYTGAWWYTYQGCHHSNLNGKWLADRNKGPRWHSLSGSRPVAFSEMKIRRVD